MEGRPQSAESQEELEAKHNFAKCMRDGCCAHMCP